MTNTNEPRALTAALSSPAFVTQGGGLAMHVANRHVSRWAPEVGEPGANRIRPLRNLGFVDRLVSPWIESAQRSASLRMFSQYITSGAGERQPQNVSWVFPRPWYQDELDWMAAARAVGSQTMAEPSAAPQMFTTRGTYVAPAQQVRESSIALPSVLHEYVAPSLSIARPATASVSDAYSPLVSLASTQAAQVVSRAMAPILSQSAQPSAPETAAAARMSPGLRAVLSTMLERTAQVAAYGSEPSRVSSYAPEMVTPPAPRAATPTLAVDAPSASSFEQATQVADHYSEQRARISELQRVARVAAEREAVAREAAQQARTAESRTQQSAPTEAARVAEVRAAEARAIEARQAEIQQRAGDVAAQRQIERTVADTARREAERVAVDAERARIEERIAQRIAERTQTQADAQRLHSAAREAAARDARTELPPVAPTAGADVARPAPAAESRVAAEIAAAVASLPPELASMVAGSIGNRPERAAQAIAELSDALRTVELLARTTAAGGSFESTRGPRVVMPAGLGGLVSTVERTVDRGTMTRMPSIAPVAAQAQAQAPRALAPRAIEPMRIPAMTFLASSAQAPSTAPARTSAIGAAAAATPAALSHVAWSDRWLARFAGAKASSLDVLAATSAAPELRLEMLAAAAPGSVFVAPLFDRDERSAPQPVAFADGTPIARDTVTRQPDSSGASAASVVRIADDAETPDELFAMISRARTRAVASPTAAAAAAAAPSTPAPAVQTFERETLADLVAHAAPSAPGAGLAAGLASSPFAPALRHVLPLGAAPTFDVRALFGGGLGATYLAGLLAAGTDELSVPASMPTWASWGQAASAMTSLPSLGGDETPVRDIPGFDMTYVAPTSDVPRTSVPVDGGADVSDAGAFQAQSAAAAEHVTTLRSALLSFDVETIAAQAGVPAETRVSAPTVTAAQMAQTMGSGPLLAHSMMSSLSLPMLGESAALGELGALDVGGVHAHSASYTAPGMIADRALGWSVAQERSTSDLSFDFVSPELVLAARVYGLGPAEAAQAARLAIAGPGQLTAMAGAVDRTFVQALAIENERRGEARNIAGRTLATAYPTTSGETAAVARPTTAPSASVSDDASPYLPALSHTAFGVERRAPRGAFLWPAATTAALGMNAAGPDGELSMSVAALELLAAQAVAELGTYAALSDRGTSMFGGLGGLPGGDAPAMTFAGGSASMTLAAAAEGVESDVLASASAMVPAARREKFNALYVALGQSSQGKAWSPAARAARALALAGRGDESMSARERANIAWDVLPMVYGGPFGDEQGEGAVSTGDMAARQIRRRDELRSLDPVFVDGRPGLGGLSARAGEALGSYVTPSSSQMMTQSYSGASGSSSRGDGAVMRAPTAAQELVQTGRPAGRHGGGEVEIPAWFEQAARKMLEERSSVSDGISLAELTLVQTAAPQQLAASSRQGGSSGGSLSPQPTGSVGAEKDKIDIEKIANEVYREILVLMDIARARNGEPYL